MRRFASLALVLLLVAGCGSSESSSSANDRSKRQTLAGVDLKRDTEVSEVLAWLRDHEIEATQLIREYDVGDETYTSAMVVGAGSSDAQIRDRYRSETKTAFEGEGPPEAFPGVTPATLRQQRKNFDEARRLSQEGPALVTRLEVSGPADVLHSLADDPLVAQVFVKP